MKLLWLYKKGAPPGDAFLVPCHVLSCSSTSTRAFSQGPETWAQINFSSVELTQSVCCVISNRNQKKTPIFRQILPGQIFSLTEMCKLTCEMGGEAGCPRLRKAQYWLPRHEGWAAGEARESDCCRPSNSFSS